MQVAMVLRAKATPLKSDASFRYHVQIIKSFIFILYFQYGILLFFFHCRLILLRSCRIYKPNPRSAEGFHRKIVTDERRASLKIFEIGMTKHSPESLYFTVRCISFARKTSHQNRSFSIKNYLLSDGHCHMRIIKNRCRYDTSKNSNIDG